MGDVIPFLRPAEQAEEDAEIDLLTAVDAAIRDLREISSRWNDEQAHECRRMLERAFQAARVES